MATNTYVALQTQTLSSNTAAVTFSSIPSGYTDLVIVFNGSLSSANSPAYRINGDTASNYSATDMTGDGSSAQSARNSSVAWGTLGGMFATVTAGNQFSMIINVMNYANTTTYKTVMTRTSVAGQMSEASVSLWRSTAAVTSFTVQGYNNGGAYATGSTFTLYGIAAEGQGYATGGLITSDANYYYHAFTSSGTFTPSKALTADILVVAGGGGGSGSGAGAGGLLTFASQSLTSGTSYTCTVGAGGAGSSNGQSANGSNGGNSQFGALTATVGGGAGVYTGGSLLNGLSGGSGSGGTQGGGSGSGAGLGGAGTSGQGYAGGASYTFTASSSSSGGGGGAGGVGGNAPSVNSAGVGGVGYTSSLINAMALATGTGQLSSGNYYYAGGGGGGYYVNGSAVAGGLGGGGTGSSNNAAGSSALANTGGGGGGYYSETYKTAVYNGGSGVIIVRYPR
jgi:hypothetical protein